MSSKPPHLHSSALLDRRRLIGVLGAGLVATSLPRAASAQSSHLSFADWVGAFRPRVLAKGVAPATYDGVMGSIQPDNSVFEFDKAQPEFQEPVWRYIDKRTNEWNTETGKKRIREHAPLWDRIERVYGVDRHVLCALWGLETSFGDLVVTPKYNRPVLPCLAALAWGDPRRRSYWEQELINALIIVDRGWAKPEEMIGSWAGAMGHTQWMPEVWLNMGVDFDGDGRINPFGKPDDSLAGTARYLVERGKWRKGEAWGYEVTLDPQFDFSLADGKTQRPISEWLKKGVRRANGQAFPRPTDVARLALPAGAKGPAFALLQNFRAVKSYNPSFKYALAICHLSDKIRGGGPFLKPWPTEEKLLSLTETQEMQERLTALGFDTGGTDGRFGEKTQTAIQAWQKSTGMAPADGYPSSIVLARLRGG